MKNFLLLTLFCLFFTQTGIGQCDVPGDGTFLECLAGPETTINVGGNTTIPVAVDISGVTISLGNNDITFNGSVTVSSTTVFSGGGSAFVNHLTYSAKGNGGTGFTFAELNAAIATGNFTTLASAFASLPVELIDFTGKLSNGVATLNWSTANESSNEYFLVEHSLDGRTFTEVGQVGGQGSTAEVTNYEWQQNAKKGTNYYRLSQFDFDGSSAVLGVVSLRNDTGGGLFVQPNPGLAGREISLSISAGSQPELVQLVSISGQKWQLRWSENGTVQLPVHLSTGLYYLQVSSAGEHWAEPLMIIE